MKIEEHPIIEDVLEIHRLEFGNFYFFNNLVVSEIHENELYTWEKAKIIIEIAERIFGKGCKPYYISNRVNDYAIIAQDWLKFLKKKYRLKNYIIIAYRKSSIVNLTFERIFYKNHSIKKFTSLEEGLLYVKNHSHS